jgi:myo-inositol-hexaphosphate 3-phosphohydrolase
MTYLATLLTHNAVLPTSTPMVNTSKPENLQNITPTQTLASESEPGTQATSFTGKVE